MNINLDHLKYMFPNCDAEKMADLLLGEENREKKGDEVILRTCLNDSLKYDKTHNMYTVEYFFYTALAILIASLAFLSGKIFVLSVLVSFLLMFAAFSRTTPISNRLLDKHPGYGEITGLSIKYIGNRYGYIVRCQVDHRGLWRSLDGFYTAKTIGGFGHRNLKDRAELVLHEILPLGSKIRMIGFMGFKLFRKEFEFLCLLVPVLIFVFLLGVLMSIYKVSF